MSLKNSQLENYPTEALTQIEQQRRFVLRMALTPMQCPHCLKPASQIEASGKDVDDYDTMGAAYPDMACPHCRTELEVVVPFMGPPRWKRKHAAATTP